MTKPSIENVLREFMNDIETVGVKQTGQEWPDLLVTYNKARMALSVQLDSRPTGTDTKWQTDEEFAALDAVDNEDTTLGFDDWKRHKAEADGASPNPASTGAYATDYELGN